MLEPHRTALVVVDMVPFFADIPYVRGIMPNIQRLASTVRATGGVVAWVLPSADEPSPARIEFLGPTVAETYRASGGPGELRDRLLPELQIGPDDVLVEKSAASAFFPGRCELPAHLEQRKVDTVMVAGTVANVCCESTARDASVLGYRVIMVADANAAVRDQDLNATLHTIYRSFGDVRTTDELIELLASGE
ncbi:MAG: cysteine hydrolase [Acidimicrobiaceae bacterium]|nr:cysteine hydrolase [Acidimicrobiaceae bacterium]